MSESQFFEMTFDDEDRYGWEIATDWLNSDGSWKDVWMFTRCEPAPRSHGLKFAVSNDGIPRDFNIANFNIPIVSQNLGELLSLNDIDCIERIPISIASSSDTQWEVLNILQRVDCIDYDASVIDFFPSDPNDPSVKTNPTRAGMPRGIRSLRIKPEKCSGKHIFRIKNWEVPIIVSKKVKDFIEAKGMKGIRFLGV